MDNESTITEHQGPSLQTPDRAAPGDHLAPGPAIGPDWAQRRLDLFAQVEATLHEGIAGALKTAADIRADVERDASAYLQRLAADRARLGAEIDQLAERRRATEQALEGRRLELEESLAARGRAGEAQLAALRQEAEAEVAALREEAQAEVAALREEAQAEVAELRQEAEAEVAALRSATRSEIDQMVQEAEGRRARVAAEVRALEEQVAQIQGVIDSFLDNQLQTLRGSLGSARGVSRPGARPAQDAGPTPDEDAPPAGWPPPGNDAAAPFDALAGAAGSGPEGEGPRPAGPGEPAPDETAQVRPAMIRDGVERTSVVITGVPHFSRARALWQAIQEVPGVAEARALNYQQGVLALEVQHDPSLDLSASVADLPGWRLRVSETAPGELRLTAEA